MKDLKKDEWKDPWIRRCFHTWVLGWVTLATSVVEIVTFGIVCPAWDLSVAIWFVKRTHKRIQKRVRERAVRFDERKED